MVGALTQGRELRDFDRRDEKRVRCDAASEHSAKDPNCSKCGVRLLPERLRMLKKDVHGSHELTDSN